MTKKRTKTDWIERGSRRIISFLLCIMLVVPFCVIPTYEVKAQYLKSFFDFSLTEILKYLTFNLANIGAVANGSYEKLLKNFQIWHEQRGTGEWYVRVDDDGNMTFPKELADEFKDFIDSQKDPTSSTGYTSESGLEKIDCNYKLVYFDAIGDSWDELMYDTYHLDNVDTVMLDENDYAGSDGFLAHTEYCLTNQMAGSHDAGFYYLIPWSCYRTYTISLQEGTNKTPDSSEYPMVRWYPLASSCKGGYLVGNITVNAYWDISLYTFDNGVLTNPLCYLAQLNPTYDLSSRTMLVKSSLSSWSSSMIPRSSYSKSYFYQDSSYYTLSGHTYDPYFKFSTEGGYYYSVEGRLRAETPGIYKVFATVTDLQNYIDAGGSDVPVPQNYTSITYNITTNNYTYNTTNNNDNGGNGGTVTSGSSVNIDTTNIENKLDSIWNLNYEQSNLLSDIKQTLIEIDNHLTSGFTALSNGLTTVSSILSNIYTAVTNIWSNTGDIRAYVMRIFNEAFNPVTNRLDTIIQKMPDQTVGNTVSENGIYTPILNKIYHQLVIGNTLDLVDTIAENLWQVWDHFVGEATEDLSEIADAAVNKFPFCIPGVIVSAITLTNVTANPPAFTIPLKFQSLNVNYTMQIDFTSEMWSGCRTVINYMSLFLAFMGFVMLTIKLVKKGDN